MVQYERPATPLDSAFAALADPTRRAILAQLGSGGATISELAAPFEMSLTGMKKHVQVLEAAALVKTEKVGRARRCTLGASELDDVQRWIDSYRSVREGQLDRLAALLEDQDKGERR